MNAATILNPSTHRISCDHIPPTDLTAPGELRRPFEELAEALLQAAGGHEVIFLQNVGNFGDSLIRYGTMRFFEDIGLRYREYDMVRRVQRYMAFGEGIIDRLRHRHLFVYSGSGKDGPTLVREVSKMFIGNTPPIKTFSYFQLPFSIFGLPNDIPVFVRDRFESHQVVQQARFCHDMAFYLALVTPDRLFPDLGFLRFWGARIGFPLG